MELAVKMLMLLQVNEIVVPWAPEAFYTRWFRSANPAGRIPQHSRKKASSVQGKVLARLNDLPFWIRAVFI